MLDLQTLTFMHRRNENSLCAQAMWFCKTVQTHRACARKAFVCLQTAKSRENMQYFVEIDAFRTRFDRHFVVPYAAGRRTTSGVSGALLRHLLGCLPGASRVFPGRFPDASRTPPGRLSDTSRTPCAYSDTRYALALVVFAVYEW